MKCLICGVVISHPKGQTRITQKCGVCRGVRNKVNAKPRGRLTMMRDWDKEEKDNDNFSGQVKRDEKDHDHHFDLFTGRCAICLKTREQLRKEW